MSDTILIFDQNDDRAESLSAYLADNGKDVHHATRLAEAQALFEIHSVDAVFLALPEDSAECLSWLKSLRRARGDLAIITLCGVGNVNDSVAALKAGADQFLLDSASHEDIASILNHALATGRARRKESARRRIKRQPGVFVGSGTAAARAWELASTASESDSPVLITGETGTGKGVMAQWIHDHSSRSGEDFVSVNCSALGGELLASELFGHRKGAFTSAVEDRAGLIEVANGGTLFLDEIGVMDVAVQSQLLKVLEEKRYRRLGETKQRRSDFRLVCATNSDLPNAVNERKFRADLFYRICVFPIEMPPLRDLQDDLAALIDHQFRDLVPHGEPLAPDIIERLCRYSWPGNVRELRNVLERAIMLARGGPVLSAHLRGLDDDSTAFGVSQGPEVGDWSLESNEARHLQAALDHFGEDVSLAAEAVGVSRATFYRKLKRYGIIIGEH